MPSETTSSKGQPASSETNIPTRTPPGRARESVNPLDFQSRPATCAAERLLAQGASKSLRDRPSEIEDFGWSPRVLIFSEGSLLPGEKIASLQIPRPEIRRISAESEKGWCGGESVPSASGCAREGRSPLELPIKTISAGNRIRFRGGGSGGGACSPVHLALRAFIL